MKKILLSAVTTLALSQYAVADTTKKVNDKLADISMSSGVTNIYVEPITNATVETEPISWFDFKAKLYIGGFEPTFGYSRSFSGEATDTAGQSGETNNASERLLVSIPLDKIGFDGVAINYNKYTFNSYLIADPSLKIVMIDASNTTYKTGRVNKTDQGVELIEDGQSAGLTITSERVEITKTLKKRFAGASTSYIGLFAEQLTKPWEDPTTMWVDGGTGNQITVLLSQAKFTSFGLTFGTQRSGTDIPTGLSIQSIGFDFAYMDIALTDDYNFSDKLGDNMQASKVGMKINVAYKMLKGVMGKDSSLIFNGFVNYDYYYLDTDTTSDQDQSFPLSNDYLYGISGTLSF